MTDRYEKATNSVRGIPAPDQWDEITERASEPDTIVRLDEHDERGRRRRGPLVAVAAAASATAIAGAVWLVQDDSPSVVSDDPPPGTDPLAEDVLSEHIDIDDLVTICDPLTLTLGDADTAVFGDVLPADPDDPRVPEAARPSLTGVVSADTTTRAIFVLNGYPDVGADEAAAYQHDVRMFEDVQATIAPYDDGWTARIEYRTSDGAGCPLTLLGLGLNEDEFIEVIDLGTLRMTLPE